MSNSRVQLEVALGAIFIIVSAILLVVLGFQEEDALASAIDVQNAEAIENGAHLFGLACRECHGEFGQGGLGAILNDPHFFDNSPEGRLAEVGWTGTLEDFIISTVAAGRPVSTRPDQYPGKGDGNYAMPAWSQDFGGPYRNDQIRDVAKFILNWGKQYGADTAGGIEYVPLPAPRSESPEERGKGVFLGTGGCGACHTIDGDSAGVVGPNLTNIATVAATRVDGLTAEEYIRQSILEPNAYLVPDCPNAACVENLMPQNFGELLSDAQFEDLIFYLMTRE
jgi:mono/diheme cytochrome c family protein